MQSMFRHVKSYLNVLRDAINKKTVSISDIGICPCDYKSDNVFPDDSAFSPYAPGQLWGNGFDSHAWFHFVINVPDEMKNDETLTLTVSSDKGGWDASNPQFLCYVDGVMRQAFDTNHRELILGSGSDKFDVYVYSYTGPRVKDAKFYASISTSHEDVRQFYYDALVPFMALECIPDNTADYADILTTLSMSFRLLNVLEPLGEEFHESVKAASDYLHKNLYDRACTNDLRVVCIGHTHIDIAWLWTVAQTREKAQRSFSTVIELMKRYPEYKFMSSQAYLYKAVKEEAPELYEEIKAMIAAGRWEVEGAMWVEADCNLSSGESLVRQVVYGKNFFRDEFGVESRVLWLPDVFGYSAALPQILKKSGVDWFVTSKISWNDTDIMPYDLFSWRGIDGTAVNALFMTAQNKDKGNSLRKGTTYNGNTQPKMIAGSYNRFQQKEISHESLVTYGFGDGGGGPTSEMIEIAKRQLNGLGPIPKVRMEFAGDLLRRYEEKIKDNPRFPEWRGELYLEFHRGTYTSNARNKKNNRDCEFLLLNSELLSVMAGINAGLSYPAETLHKSWETVLVNQFHDIIPGSSIREVYEVCDKEYAALRETAADMRKNATDALVSGINTNKSYVVFNPHSFTGKGLVNVGDKTVFVKNIPSKGWKAMNLKAKKSGVKVNGKTVESKFYICEFDDNWEISRLYDKINDREVLLPGQTGNQFRIFEDRPDQYDAWEIIESNAYKFYNVHGFSDVSVIENGARTGIRIIRNVATSVIDQTIWFNDDIARIDFDTKLDWHDKHRILRTAFPVDINTDKATFEVQFGTLERPTHKNTSWDRMKFETCAHKYADMSEGNYGVSLINNCKYGHDIHDQTMQLTLLKCPSYPNEVADEGLHSFTYSIMPHAGALKDSDTLSEAYMLNFPMYAVPASAGGSLPEEWSLISSDSENVVIETVKQAEKSEDIIIRMYEAKNEKTAAHFKLGFDAAKISLAGIMEEELETIAEKTREFDLTVKPFEIVTLKVVK